MPPSRLRARLLLLFLALGLSAALAYKPHAVGYLLYPARMLQARSVSDVQTQYGPAAEARLQPWFERAGVAYPPPRLLLVAPKRERLLHLYAPAAEGWTLVRSYPVLAASGGPGPKLREGDMQVPEGVYSLEYLNPNSSYHLSMKLNYPNPFDRAKAKHDGRTQLGGEIFIHGRAVSVGCLAIGDEAIEELFVLVSKTGVRRVEVLVLPQADMRGLRAAPEQPAWVDELYDILRAALRTHGL